MGKRTWEPYTLLSIDPERHSQVTTDVLCDQDGRLYSPEGHPLVDYNALYAGPTRQGVPILRMLQTVKGPTLFATSLTPEEVNEARVGLVSANSYVTAALNRQFETRGGTQPPDEERKVSENARITDAGGPAAWLITDPGQAVYLVQEVDQPAPGFLVSAATLKLVHSDLTAMITGPRAGRFGFDIDGPSFFTNPTYPDRRQPYREFTIIYHMAPNATQAFPDQFGDGEHGDRLQPGPGRLRDQLRDGRHRRRDPRQPAGRRPDGQRRRGRPEVRGVLPQLVGGRRPGDGRGRRTPPTRRRRASAGAATKPLFSVDGTGALVGDLDAGKADGLKAAFAKAGITLSDDAIASPICVGKEWIVLDPGARRARPRPAAAGTR